MSEMIWQDPPEAMSNNGRRTLMNTIVPALKAHPGKWARIHEHAKSPSAGRSLQLRYGCEMAIRRNDDSTYAIFARWPEEG